MVERTGRSSLVLVVLLVGVIVTLVKWQNGVNDGEANYTGQKKEVVVHRIIDGDTITYIDTQGGGERRVRLYGIDTPERGEEGYQEAKEYLDKRLKGKLVTLHGKGIDVYGRELADIYDTKQEWINKELLDKGFAKVYQRGKRKKKYQEFKQHWL